MLVGARLMAAPRASNPMLRLPLLIAALALSAGLRAWLLDPAFDARRVHAVDQDSLKSPGPSLLRLVTLEHRLGAADITWMAIVQEIGRARQLPDAVWDRVERWSSIATDLDPRYFTVYHSVAVNLSVWARRAEASDRVSLRGVAALPDRWELRLVLGFNAYFMRGDAALGSDYIAEASRLPGAPPYLASLAGRMRYQSGDEFGAIRLLESMIEALDGRAREEAETRLAILRTEPVLQAYDAACKQYRAQVGQVPTVSQLRESGLVNAPDSDALGNKIELDADCIARTSLIGTREFEAMKRVGSFARTATKTDESIQIEAVGE